MNLPTPNTALIVSPARRLLARWLALLGYWLLVTSVATAANVRIWFPLPYVPNKNDTNVFKAVQISTNIWADGGVQTIGLPIRIQPDTNGYATNYFGPGWYAVTEPVQNVRVVINVYDSSSAQYDYTNLLQSGFNTYVVTIYGTNPPPYYDEITNALGYDPFALIAAQAATMTNLVNTVSNNIVSQLQGAISATNTANLTTTTGLVNNAGAQLTNAITAASANGTNNLNSASNSLTAILTAAIAATNTANLTTTTGLVNNAGAQLTNAITAVSANGTNNLNSASNSLTAILTAAIAATNTANLTTTTGLVNNAASVDLSNLQATNAGLTTMLTLQSNLIQFVSAQIGHDTNYLIIPAAGVANVIGTDVWSGFAYTNINGISYWSNNIFYASGIAAYGSPYVVGTTYTNLSGSNPVPVPAFAIKSIAAGTGVSIANNFGSQTIAAMNTGYSIVLAGVGIGVASNNTAGVPVFTISNTATTNSTGTNATTIVIGGTGILVSSNNFGGIPQFTITADTNALATISTVSNLVNNTSNSIVTQLQGSIIATNTANLTTTMNLIKSSGSNYLQAISGVGTNLTVYNPLLLVNSNSTGIFISSITFSGFTNTSADGTFNYDTAFGALTNANGDGYIAAIIDPNNTNGTISGITPTNWFLGASYLTVSNAGTTVYNGTYTNTFLGTGLPGSTYYKITSGLNLYAGCALVDSHWFLNTNNGISYIFAYSITNYAPQFPTAGIIYSSITNGSTPVSAPGPDIRFYNFSPPSGYIPNFTNILSPGVVFTGTIPGAPDYAIFSPSGNQQANGYYTNYVINEWNTNGAFAWLNGTPTNDSVLFCTPANAQNGSSVINVPGTASGTSTQPMQAFPVGVDNHCVSTTYNGTTTSPCDCPGAPRIPE